MAQRLTKALGATAALICHGAVLAQIAPVADPAKSPDILATLTPEQRAMPFAAVNPAQPEGDRLETPRRLAAAIVAADGYKPRQVTDVGSFTGEFVQAFMAQFPAAKGQWTEPVDTNRNVAEARLGQYGPRIRYHIGCPGRDLADNCVPAGTDVLLTSWLSIHQDLEGIRRFYKAAHAIVPASGWVINIDHVVAPDAAWQKRLVTARGIAADQKVVAQIEGPPVHHPQFVSPGLDQQVQALRDAGFTEIHVAWQRLDTVLLMARK